MILQTLADTGSPIVREILDSRKSSDAHLLAALLTTTTLVIVWVGCIWVSPSPNESRHGGMSPKQTELSQPPSISLVPVDERMLIDPAPLSEETDLAENETDPAVQKPTPRVPDGQMKVVPGKPLDVSQKSGSVDVMRITVGYTNEPLEKILDDITMRTGLLFTYNENLIASYCCVDVDLKERTVHELLTELLGPRDLCYAQHRWMIAVYPIEVQNSKPKPSKYNPRLGKKA
jgi:hypothetical protein